MRVGVEKNQDIDIINRCNWLIPERGITDASKIIGQDLTIPATDRQIEFARRYLGGRLKEGLERALTLPVGVVLSPYMIYCARRIQKIDGASGYFKHQIGIFFGDMITQTKIRTMEHGAKGTKPFETTTFTAGDPTLLKEKRILGDDFARKLRRSGFDEFPQFWDVILGRMSLVGIRGFTIQELEGVQRLWELRDDNRVNLNPLARQVLEEYPKLAISHRPKPGMFGMLAALYAKDTPHMLRMFSDLEYMKRASLSVDIRIFRASFHSRVIKRRGAR